MTRTGEITRVLREEVLRGRYRPGERLPSERDLAARFETTRDVVRVALKRLEQLGMAQVRRGGARVQPLREASLDALGHLIELEGSHHPNLVDQMLEVLGAMIATGARRLAESGAAAAIERALTLVERARIATACEAELREALHQLGRMFIDASDNLVMDIVRRRLRSELLIRLGAEDLARRGERTALLGHAAQLRPHLDALARDLEKRDGPKVYEDIHQTWLELRREVRDALEAPPLEPA